MHICDLAYLRDCESYQLLIRIFQLIWWSWSYWSSERLSDLLLGPCRVKILITPPLLQIHRPPFHTNTPIGHPDPGSNTGLNQHLTQIDLVYIHTGSGILVVIMWQQWQLWRLFRFLCFGFLSMVWLKQWWWMHIRKRSILARRIRTAAFCVNQEAELRAAVTALAMNLLLRSSVHRRSGYKIEAKHSCRSFQHGMTWSGKETFTWAAQCINICAMNCGLRCSMTAAFRRQLW